MDKDATKAARPTDVPGGEGVLPVDRVVPGATVVPTDKTGEKAAPGAAIPPPTGEAGDVTATGTGGNQKTDINIAPPVVGVPPVVTVPGVPVVTPGSEKAVEVPGEPVQVAPGSKVLDEAGRPVDLAPGRMVVLPNGGKIVDEQGKTSVVPPGGRVLLPGRIMTPGDFLPKAEGDAKAAQEGKKKAETPPADSKPTPPAEPTQKKKPGSTEKPEKPAQAPKSEAKPKKGDPFKVPMSACEKQTLDFLAGCWRGEVGLSDKSKVNIQLCFDANGVGRRVDRYTRDGKRCSGASTARWEKGRISFSFDTLYCSNGEAGTDIPVVCEGCGEDTKCIGSIYVKNKGMVAKSNFRIVRE
ncbi:hypothetical protein G3N56_09280 [Desulfovibrio sulfodismutans]|uniref:Uncharacterized protein n=1 Tax=Desulfolutivibrio sulfodismutans TaxID=63561 RepID=A0A7K3NL67_9BACT|nr:hypothetical protein [Desulfolutivibrio sulfodismutans]NDY56931.1 hypothetical protein [Desulfolutivibrio sulfodismutans]QLA12952.1 hypothetical protein GD606_12065 [Desulfolutivibrio sulfodismutans DSM 3696]